MIQKKMSGKIRDEHPVYGGKNTSYLSKLLWSECANWAIESSQRFVDEFFERMEVDKPNYKTRWDQYQQNKND